MNRTQKDAEARRAFRDALGAFATGVTIVTTSDPELGDVGVTANSFNSVSLEPPMVLWSLSRNAYSLGAFQRNPCFAVHVLAADQDHLSQRFAKQGADKFSGIELARGDGNVPLLSGCAARFICATSFMHDGGDHLIFVGRVTQFEASHRAPLLFHAGRYALAVEKDQADANPDDWGDEPDSSFSRDFLVYLLGRAQHQMQLELRSSLEQHTLSEDEWFTMSLLGVSDGRTIAQLDRLLWPTGKRATYERMARLATMGLVSIRGGHDPGALVTLTDLGRRHVVELIAAAKAVEAHAERNLGPGETRMLKIALRKLIRDTPTRTGDPHPVQEFADE